MIVMTVTFFVVQKLAKASFLSTQGHSQTSLSDVDSRGKGQLFSDLVDVRNLDLYADEHQEDEDDSMDDELRAARIKGKWRLLWRLWYWLA